MMKINRRNIVVAGLAGWLGTDRAMAAEWPERPIRLAIGYPPGGAMDGVARPLLEPMAKALGQPVVMDYKPGAGGATAAEAAARAAPDGYAIHLIEGSTFTALPLLRNLGFDPARSLQPIGMVAAGGAIVVAHPSSGISSIADLIQQAKAKPGQLAYGTSGVGGAQHLAAELFQAMTGIRLHHIPYKGGAPAMNDLLGGQIPLLFSSMTPAVPMVTAGKVKALGVTSTARSSSLPDVRTIAEQGVPGFDAEIWLALVAPTGLPATVSAKISAALAAAHGDPSVQAQIRSQGYEPMAEGPNGITARIQRESAKWQKVIKEAQITLG
jgi:tripartite-type tricarboxylate transporter receptor subunit TctC